MPEASTASPPEVHQYGLETGPSAAPDTSGLSTEVRGFDGALQETLPHDTQPVSELTDLTVPDSPEGIEELRSMVEVEEGLGGIAIGGAQQSESGPDLANLESLAERAAERGSRFGKEFDLTSDDRERVQSLVDEVKTGLGSYEDDPQWQEAMALRSGIQVGAMDKHEGTNVSKTFIDGGSDAEVKLVVRDRQVDQHTGESTDIPGIQVPSRIFNLLNTVNSIRDVEKTLKSSDSFMKGANANHFGADVQRLAAAAGEARQDHEAKPTPAQAKEVNKQQPSESIQTTQPNTQTPTEEAALRLPEGPAMMQSLFELATNPNVDLETRIAAIETYVKNQEAREDQGPPGETIDEYYARLDRITSGQESAWSPELKYAKEVLLTLKTLRGSGSQQANSPTTSQTGSTQTNGSAAGTPKSKPLPKPKPAANPSPTQAQKPKSQSQQTSSTPSGTNATQQQTPVSNQTAAPQSPNHTQQQKNPKAQATQPVQPVPPQAQAAAGNLSFGGSDQTGAPASPEKPKQMKPEQSITSTEPYREDQKSVTEQLGGADKQLWDAAARLEQQQSYDDELSQRFRELKDDFTSQRAAKVVDLAERRAQKLAEVGNISDANNMTELAEDVIKLNERISGVSLKPAA